MDGKTVKGINFFEPGDSASTRLDKLVALLEPTATNLSRDVTLVAELVGVPMDGRYPGRSAHNRNER